MRQIRKKSGRAPQEGQRRPCRSILLRWVGERGAWLLIDPTYEFAKIDTIEPGGRHGFGVAIVPAHQFEPASAVIEIGVPLVHGHLVAGDMKRLPSGRRTGAVAISSGGRETSCASDHPSGPEGEHRRDSRNREPNGRRERIMVSQRKSSVHPFRYQVSKLRGATTCSIKELSHSPSTMKCAVAPSSAASIRLWFT